MLCFASARELAHLVRTRQLSARELIAENLKQIDRLNPQVNAIVTLTAESALDAAQAADDRQARGETLPPLHGLPVLHKDLFETRGVRTTFGSPLFKDYVPGHNHPIVDRLAQAGAILLGKTNTPEFGAGSQTFNELFGPTRNPYDLSKTCGGSSGGSAVSLACGFSAIATGTDVGGSLRNPAAFCNVVGMRPGSSVLSTTGCMTRSVADLAFAESFAQPLDRHFKNTRIAWFNRLSGVPFDPQVRTIVDSHRSTFQSLGCIVETAEPDFSDAEIAFRIRRAWNSAQLHGALFEKHPDAFKPTLRCEIQDGLRLTPADLDRADAAHAQLQRNTQTFFEQYEYFVLPTVQLPPFDVALEYPREIDGVKFDTYIDWMKSCWYISATGNPAISVPAGFTGSGLPVGLQIVGRRHQDFAVLQLAHAFEQATGFARCHPLL